MFQFSGFASVHARMTGLQPAGLSHSEICGSIRLCQSPQLIAAYHVLLRLWEPRHSPYALNYFLTYVFEYPLCFLSHHVNELFRPDPKPLPRILLFSSTTCIQSGLKPSRLRHNKPLTQPITSGNNLSPLHSLNLSYYHLQTVCLN